jgi:hypothetical protein
MRGTSLLSGKTRRVVLRISLIAASLLALATCNLFKTGLGPKVDVTPPELAITSPVQGAYLRGSVVLTGTATDDIGVSSLVVAYPTAGGGTIQKSIAVAANAWTVSLPSGGALGLAEGKDTITVTAKAASGKAATASVFAYIDNTPPTVLVTTPTTYGATPPIYSGYVDISGEAYDASPVTSVAVTLSYLSGGTTKTVTQTANGTNSWSSRFFLSTTDGGPLGLTSDGTVLSYSVVATDAAGNASTYYYHSQDIYGLLGTGKLFPTIQELGQLDQGGTSPSQPTGIAFSALSAVRIADTAASRGNLKFTYYFTPTIQYANLDPANPSANILAPGSVIVGNIIPPSNAGAVDPSSLVFKIFALADFQASPQGTPQVSLTAANPLGAQLVLTNLGSSQSFRVALENSGGANLTPGQYVLDVTAAAQGSGTAHDDVTFGIDTSAPTLTETSVGNNLAIYDRPFVLSGIAGSLSGLASLTVDESADGGVTWTTAYGKTYAGNPSSDSWSTSPAVSLPKAGSDGSYGYRITLTTSTGMKTIVYRSVIYDQTPPTLTVTAPTPGAWGSSSSLSLSGVAGDGSGSGVAAVYYLVDTAAADHSAEIATWAASSSAGAPTSYTSASWEQAGGIVSNWTGSSSFSGEGYMRLWVVAVDRAGNHDSLTLLPATAMTAGTTYTIDTLGSTNFTAAGAASNTVGLSFVASGPGTGSGLVWKGTGQIVPFGYDQSPPSLAITSAVPATITAATAASFAGFWGTVSDSDALAGLTVQYSKNGVSQGTVPIAPSGTSWSWTPFASGVDAAGHTTDGLWSFVFTATDIAGKTMTVTKAVTIDTAAPTTTVTSPGSGGWVSTTALSITGVATDGTGSGVAKVYVKVDGLYAAGTSTDHSAEDPTVPANSWTLATGQTSWTASITLSAEGRKTLWVKAEDAVGNVTTAAGAVSSRVDFGLDLNPPTLGFTDAVGSLVNTGFSFSGTTTDTNPAGAPTLAVSVDGGAVQAVSVVSGAWSYAASVDTAGHGNDGSHTYVFTSTDISGKTTTLSRSLTIDTRPPTVLIAQPGSYTSVQPQYWLSGATASLGGSAADSGTGASGVAKVYYKVDSLGTSHATDSEATIASTWTLAAGTGTWSFTENLTSLGEGQFTLWTAAYDNAGNLSAIGSRDFGVDQAPPSLTETSHPASSYTKSAFTLAGAVGDTNALASLTITESKNGGTAGAVSLTSVPASLVGAKSATYTSQSLPLGGVADGSYAYVLTATDVAGKTTTVSRTVNIDTTPPTVSLTAIPAWVSSSAYTISGTAADPNSGASGVATVQYQLDSGSWTNAVWTDTSGGGNTTGTWSATLTALAEGHHTLGVQATDAAGNITTLAATAFGVDVNPPSLSETVLGTSSQVTKTAAFTMSGTIGDTDPASVAGTTLTVTVSVNGGAAANAAIVGSTWSYTQPKVDGNYSYVVTATDVSGKTTSLNRLVLLDSTPPALAVSSPAPGAWTSSNSLSIGGTAVDGAGSGVKDIYYLVDGAANDHSSDIAAWNLTNGASAPVSGSAATWTAAAGLPSSWSGSSTLPAEGAQTLWVVAADKAGNTSTLSKVAAGSFAAGAVYTIASIGTTDFTALGASSNTVGLSFTATGPGSGSGSAWTGSGVAVPFGLDLNPPALSETAVNTSATVIRNSSIAFSGSASDTDALAAAHSLTVTVDGGAAADLAFTTAPNWIYTYAVDGATHAQDGIHSFVFTATDIAGKKTTVTRTILVDTTPAALSVTSPVNAVWTGASPYTVSGTASDGTGAGVSQVWTIVDNAATSHAADTPTAITTGGAWKEASGTTSWSASWALAPEGTKTLWVAVLDAAGNWSTSYTAVNFGYDVTPPALGITPMGGFRSAFSIAGTVSDGASGVASLQYKIDSGSFSPVTIAPGWSVAVPAAAFAALSEGSHTVTVQAIDAAGNQSTQAAPFNKDTTPPTLTYNNISVGGGTVDQDTNPVLTGTLNDVSGVASATYTLQSWNNSTQTWNTIAAGASLGSPTGATNWSWTLDLSSAGLDLPDGKYQIAIGAADTPGNAIASPVAVPFLLSRSNPGAAIFAPSLGTFQNAAFPLAGSSSDPNGITLVRAKLASGSVDFSSGATNALPALSATAATGAPGLFSTSSPHGLNVGDQVYLWGTPMPVAPAGSLQTGTAYYVQSVPTSTSFTLAATSGGAALAINTSTATNLLVGIAKDSFSTFHPSVPVTVSGSTMSAPNHGLANGDLVYFQGTSLPGPTSAATAYYVVNATAATFQVSTTSGGTALPLTSTGSAVAVYSPTHAVNWLIPAMAVTGFGDGPVTVYVQAAALSGKLGQTSRDFTLDTTAPTIAVSSPGSGTRSVGNLTISGTSTDPGSIPSGVTGTIQYQIGNGYNLSNPASWTSANVTGGAYSWSIGLGDMSSYANATYATQCDASGNPASGTNLWKLPIVFQALDKAGNAGQLTSYFLILDPNGNIPVVTVTQPATGLTFGGQQRITGTATQPVAIYGVEVAVDPAGGNNFPAAPVAVSISGSSLNASANPLTNGMMVFLSGTVAPQIGGAAVSPTSAYWVINATATGFQLAAASGGTTPIAFSSSGSGVTASVWAPATLTSTGNNVTWYYDINTTGAYPQNGASSQQVNVQARAWNSPTLGGSKGTLSGTLTTPLVMSFNSSFPQIQNILVGGQSYYSQITTRGTIALSATLSSSKGIAKVESVEGSPLSGSTTMYDTASGFGATASHNAAYWSATVTPPAAMTSDSFSAGHLPKLLIAATGGAGDAAQFLAAGAPSSAAGTVFTPTAGTSLALASGSFFEADASGNFDYALSMTIDSAQLYSNTSGQYVFNIRVTDMTSPVPEVSSQPITLNEDNYYPTSYPPSSPFVNPALTAAGTFQIGTRYMIVAAGTTDFTAVGAAASTPGLVFVATGSGSGSGTAVPVLTGTSFKIQGSSTDTGTGSGPISGLNKIVVYLTNTAGTQILDIKNGGGVSTAASSLTAMDMAGGGTVGAVPYPDTTVYSNYFASIDTLGGTSTNGLPDSYVIDGNARDWWVQLDTTRLTDGPVTVHYVIWDQAGNATHYAQSSFVSNHAPSLSNVVLGTDLTGAGTINATQTYSSNYASTGFTGRNKLLALTIDSVYDGSNGSLSYSLSYAGHDYLNPSGQAGVTVSGVTANSETVTLNFASISPSIPDTTVANGATFTFSAIDQTPGSNQSYGQSVSLNIHNNDTTPPTINVAPLGKVYSTPVDPANGGVNTDSGKTLGPVSSYGANIGASGGHVEYVSPLTAGASAVSGQVVIKGKAWDDASLQKITVTIPGFNGGSGVGAEFTIASYSGGLLSGLSGTGWSFAVDAGSQSLSLADGQVLNWSFTWDSSLIATVAATNVTLTFKDYNNGTPSLSGSSTMLVDIVPYVSKITSALSSGYSSVPSVLNRSANGAYPVRENETLTIDGYNFNGSSTTVTANGTGLTVTPVAGKTTTEVQANVGTTATSGALTAMVNSINSINNLNTAINPWNMESNNVNNNTLTDHRTLDIWKITSVLSDGTVRYPTMNIASSATAAKQYIGWAYDQSENYYYMTRTSDHTNRIFESNPTRYYDTTFAFDEQGNTFGEGNSGDITAGGGTIQYWSSVSFFYLNPSGSATDLQNGYESSTGYKARIVGLSSDGTVANTNSNRVQNPDLIAALQTPGSALSSTNPVNAYLCYYDAVLNAVMLRTGTVTSAPLSTGALAEKGGGFGVYGDTPGAITIASASGTAQSGQYSAIALDPVTRTTLVAVWYDNTNHTLWYSYNTAPTTDTTQWQANAKAIDTNFAGWYCDVTVDGSGAVHIAYNRSSSGDLCYAYLPSIASAAAPSVVTVDSYLSVGQYLKIGTLKNASSQYVPYIAYYASSFASTSDSVKVAWRSNMTSLQDGAVNDLYTNAWEAMTLPLANVPKAYKVSLGFKDFTGSGSNLVPVLGYATNAGIEYSYMK